jgi:hypothetical protein
MITTATAASLRVAECETKMLRDGDATSARDAENSKGLPLAGEEAGDEEAPAWVNVPQTVTPPSDDEPAP